MRKHYSGLRSQPGKPVLAEFINDYRCYACDSEAVEPLEEHPGRRDFGPDAGDLLGRWHCTQCGTTGLGMDFYFTHEAIPVAEEEQRRFDEWRHRWLERTATPVGMRCAAAALQGERAIS